MIKLENLSVRLGEFTLKDINLKISDGEYFVILGPNGAGKTVLLESIAGFYPLKAGRIWLNGDEMTRIVPEKRNIGIVYQSDALFPHLLVRDNIIFGLKLRRESPEEIEKTLAWITRLLGIAPLLHRKPGTLSGGERQKVALARALSTRPGVLLLDEPLSALDQETRENLQREISNIHNAKNITTIHVCHDFEEAMSMGKRIAVIGDGSIRQVGTPEQIFRQPNSEFVARFTMARNILKGVAFQRNVGNIFFKTGDTEFPITGDSVGKTYAIIRPEDISISSKPVNSDEYCCLQGKITDIINKGTLLYVRVNVPPDFICLVYPHSLERLPLVKQQKVFIVFKPASVHLF